MGVIQITPDLAIDETEVQLNFVQATGPGGQNVNKVATTAQLRFDVAHSPSLPEDVRERLKHLAGRRLTGEGILLITARRFRSQEQNRQEAITRLAALLGQAAQKPKPRHRTKPSRAAKERRLTAKRRRSEIKKRRSWSPEERW